MRLDKLFVKYEWNKNEFVKNIVSELMNYLLINSHRAWIIIAFLFDQSH